MIRPAIVIIGYNREDALKRLLSSVAKADYPDGEITLIISVDRAEDHSSERVLGVAKEFKWTHGEKRVIAREESYGLKKHVLTCGDLCREYDAIIMLEDDLYVSPAFYYFAMSALEFARKDERIGGISLYDHRLNVHVRQPFEAIHDPFDNWYFQFASSWGQVFWATAWNGFRKWLTEHDEKDLSDLSVPRNVSGWSDRSWLKYYIAYLIDTDKYFLYPRISYTTNFSDAGTHAKRAVNDLQVPLAGRGKQGYRFAGLDESRSVYDAFFENTVLREQIRKDLPEPGDVTIDLYGYRGDEADSRYVLTSQSLPYLCLKSYARLLRPHDENVFSGLAGHDFFLYDRNTNAKKPKKSKAERILYDYRAITVKEMLSVVLYRLKLKR